MSEILTEKSLNVIEVPPELRGPSDEEILKNSEKILREVSGKRKKGERRPSKRVRIAMQQEKALQEAENLAKDIFSAGNSQKNNESAGKKLSHFEFRSEIRRKEDSEKLENLPEEKRELVENAFTRKSTGFCSFYANNPFDSRIVRRNETPKASAPVETAPIPSIAAPAKPVTPISGRVLKGSFGVKSSEKPKGVIVSAADLAKQRAEERAKKIREALMAKKMPTLGESSAIGTTPAVLNPDGTPVKRPRGRPRKNPII